MKRYLILAIFFSISLLSPAQDSAEDYSWWNEIHGWEEGDPGWRNWMKLSPGYMGPNALPVPEVKKGIITASSESEITFSNHFHKGDPTQDISCRLFLPFAKNKIALEMYGVVIEHYAFSEKIRDERISRDRDGKGIAAGDLYFSTLVQLSKDRRFPNTLLRLATKTASGTRLEAARYTDSPGYFFDLSFSKKYGKTGRIIFMPYAGFGFYSWQTNDENRLQNDALMYSAGSDLQTSTYLLSASFSGYSGYKNQRDRSMQLNFELGRDFNNKTLKIRYSHGLKEWSYRTLRLSFIWKFNSLG